MVARYHGIGREKPTVCIGSYRTNKRCFAISSIIIINNINPNTRHRLARLPIQHVQFWVLGTVFILMGYGIFFPTRVRFL